MAILYACRDGGQGERQSDIPYQIDIFSCAQNFCRFDIQARQALKTNIGIDQYGKHCSHKDNETCCGICYTKPDNGKWNPGQWGYGAQDLHDGVQNIIKELEPSIIIPTGRAINIPPIMPMAK